MAIWTAVGAVQRAVYAHLAGDSTLTGLAPVYDQVPQPESYPYVELAEFMENPDETTGSGDREVTVSIFAFSRQESNVELEEILDRLIYLMHGQEVPDVDSGWHIWSSKYAVNPGSEVTKMPDGLTRQLAARFTLGVQEVTP